MRGNYFCVDACAVLTGAFCFRLLLRNNRSVLDNVNRRTPPFFFILQHKMATVTYQFKLPSNTTTVLAVSQSRTRTETASHVLLAHTTARTKAEFESPCLCLKWPGLMTSMTIHTATVSALHDSSSIIRRKRQFTCVPAQHEARMIFGVYDRIRPNPHWTRRRHASKWNLLSRMGVSTLDTSNIEGFGIRICAHASSVDWAQASSTLVNEHVAVFQSDLRVWS